MALSYSLSPEVATTQKDKQSDEGNNNNQTIIENKPINVEGICEFLSEAYVEVPIVTETDSTASGSEDSSGELYEESPPKRSQPSIEEKAELISGKKRGKKPAINNRRSRGRGGKWVDLPEDDVVHYTKKRVSLHWFTISGVVL